MVDVLYIAGMGRSGSTVLERLLGQQDGFVSLGEIANTWRNGVLATRTCACRQRFDSCTFWKAVIDAKPDALSAGAAGEVARLHDRYLDNSQLWRALTARGRRGLLAAFPSSYFSTLSQLYQGIADVAGATTVVDSSKSPVYAFLLSQAAEINVRLLHLVRDPRGVVNSWTRRRIEPGTDPVSYQHRYQPWKAAALWNLCNATVHQVSGAVDGDHRFLRYEEVVQRPDAVLGDLLSGLQQGVVANWSNDRSVDFRPNHSMSGNPMRFVTGPTALEFDDGWRRELGPWQRRMVELLTFPLAHHYGYLTPESRDAQG